jgi:short-subunit dehydrogenase
VNIPGIGLFINQTRIMFEKGEEWTLITGATRGMGYYMACALAAQGRNLVLVSRNEKHLTRVARQLNEISDIIIMPIDLSIPGSSEEMWHECDRLGLRISAMINNAGFGKS